MALITENNWQQLINPSDLKFFNKHELPLPGELSPNTAAAIMKGLRYFCSGAGNTRAERDKKRREYRTNVRLYMGKEVEALPDDASDTPRKRGIVIAVYMAQNAGAGGWLCKLRIESPNKTKTVISATGSRIIHND